MSRNQDSLFGFERAKTDLDRELVAALVQAVEFLPRRAHGPDSRLAEKMPPMVGMTMPQTRRHQHFKRLPQQLIALVAKQLLHLCVDQHDSAFPVHNDHRIGCRFEQSSKFGFGALSFRDIDSRGDDISGGFAGARKYGGRPGNNSLPAIPAHPATLIFLRTMAFARLLERRLELLHLFGSEKQLPEYFPFHLGQRIPGHLFASPIEAEDPPFRVQHHYQGRHRVENSRHHIALLLPCFFGALEICDIESHPVNEPGLAVLLADHLGFTAKPDDTAITRNHAVRGTQGLAAKEHRRRFRAPAVLVVRMDVPVPANRILQPFFLGKTERRLDLRTDISLADATIEIGHKHDGRNLLHERAVPGLQIRQLTVFWQSAFGLLGRVDDMPGHCGIMLAEYRG